MTNSQPTPPCDEKSHFSQSSHRRLIGLLGLFLPVILYVVAGMRPTGELPRWDLLPSVSAYYYTGSVGVFVGVLFALSLFLFTYPGYKDIWADRLVAALGGAAALGVCLFPTAAPEGLCAPTWWREWVRVVHYVSAVLLFASFILFSIWLFRKSNIPRREDRPTEKRIRDDICIACGLIMIACVVWAASSLITHADIFWPEAVAIMAFAVSWLVKGRIYEPILQRIGLLAAADIH